MIRRMLFSAAFVLAAGLAVPATVQAQGIFVGGGVAIPTGDLADEDIFDADTGWMGIAGLSFGIGDGGLSVYGEGFYGKNGLSGDDDVSIYGAMAGLLLRIGDESVIGPYVFGGAGLMGSNFSIEADPNLDTETDFGYEFGAGLDIPLGGVGVWVEGRYMGSDTSSLFGIIAGLGFGIG